MVFFTPWATLTPPWNHLRHIGKQGANQPIDMTSGLSEHQGEIGRWGPERYGSAGGVWLMGGGEKD